MDFNFVEQAAKQANAPNTGDYRKGGLLYCGKCHTPKQCRIDWLGQQKTVPCVCDCKKAANQVRDVAIKQRERLGRIQSLCARGIQDKELLKHTFDSSQDTKFLQKCRRYVDNWERMKRENIGLMLYGEAGGGKSHAAACIVNALLAQQIPATITSFPKILADLQSDIHINRNQYLHRLNEYDLLVIDDFGVERSTEYVWEAMFSIVDERYKVKKPLIITTNLTPSILNTETRITEQRVYNRILEMCQPMLFDGENWREQERRRKMQRARESLK